jgi:hypothetical protein
MSVFAHCWGERRNFHWLPSASGTTCCLGAECSSSTALGPPRVLALRVPAGPLNRQNTLTVSVSTFLWNPMFSDWVPGDGHWKSFQSLHPGPSPGHRAACIQLKITHFPLNETKPHLGPRSRKSIEHGYGGGAIGCAWSPWQAIQALAFPVGMGNAGCKATSFFLTKCTLHSAWYPWGAPFMFIELK